MVEQFAILIGTLIAMTAVAYLIVYLTAKQEATPVNWKNFGRILEQIAPIALSLVPGIPPVLIPVIVHGIQTAESVGGTGSEKKAQAMDLVRTGILAANLTAGKQIVDPTVIHAISNGVDTVVGVVNTIQGRQVAPDADLLVPPLPPSSI